MVYKPFAAASDSTNSDGGNIAGNAVSADFLSPSNGSDGSGADGGNSGGTGEFDPAIHISRDKRNADGSFKRKRGRKPNSANSGNKKSSNNQAGIEGLTRILAIVHIGIANATKTPEMELRDDEAELLAKSTATVLDEFDIRPDPKIEAVIGLMTTAGMIYGPRMYLIAERKKAERKEQS